MFSSVGYPLVSAVGVFAASQAVLCANAMALSVSLDTIRSIATCGRGVCAAICSAGAAIVTPSGIHGKPTGHNLQKKVTVTCIL
jgi:hypothetical protein